LEAKISQGFSKSENISLVGLLGVAVAFAAGVAVATQSDAGAMSLFGKALQCFLQ
jgi:hypothetical protein